MWEHLVWTGGGHSFSLPASLRTQLMRGSASASSLPAVAGGGSSKPKPMAARLAPYGVSLAATSQRAAEEARVRTKMLERQARRERKVREELRERVLMLALEEAQQAERPAELAKMLDEQRRFLAAKNVEHADERYYAVRADPYRRFYEPTPEEVEYREAEFRRRRELHTLQRDARLAMLHANQEARSASLAAASDARLRGARERYTQRLQSIAAHSASAPTLPPPPPPPPRLAAARSTAEALPLAGHGEALNMFAPAPDAAAAPLWAPAPLQPIGSGQRATWEEDEDGANTDEAPTPARQTRAIGSVVYE